MRLRTTVLVALALIGLPLAGCLSSPAPTEAPVVDDDHPLEARYDLDVTAPNGSVGLDNWTVLHVEADANGSVVGTRLDVPEDAEVEHPDFEDFEAVVLEVVPLVNESGRSAVQTWGYLAFPELGDDFQAQGTISTELAWRNRTTPVIEDNSTIGPFFEANRLYLDVEEGDELPLVFGARSKKPVDFGLAVRFRSEWPDDEPESDLGEAIEDVEEPDTVYAASTTGRADGLQVGAYVDANMYGVFGFEIRNDHVAVEDASPIDPRPAASARQLKLDYRFEDSAGWGLGLGLEFGDVEVSDWSVDADIHGQQLSEEGVTANAHAGGTTLATGLPFYFGIAGGQSGASGHMAIDYVSTGDLALLTMIHVDLGGTLEELVGEESPTMTGTYGGLVGDPAARRTARLDDDRFTVSGPHTRIELLGSWDVPEDPAGGGPALLR